jgi:hypothetical protein
MRLYGRYAAARDQLRSTTGGNVVRLGIWATGLVLSFVLQPLLPGYAGLIITAVLLLGVAAVVILAAGVMRRVNLNDRRGEPPPRRP